MSPNPKSLEGFQKICSVNELNEKLGRRFIVNDTEIAVFLIQSEVYAVSNICPHMHTALIYNGFVEDEFVVCPAHGWMFNIKTGKTSLGNRGLDTYETVLVEGQVYVKVIEKKYSW